MATKTVGLGGDFATVLAALASGQVLAGDTVQLLDNYSSETVTVTINNLTFDGDTTNTGIVLTLGAGLTDLTLTGDAPINVNDNPGGNTITANDGDNTVTVTGGSGRDFVHMGGGSNDRLIIDYQAAPGNVSSNGANYFYNGTNNYSVDFDGVEHFTISTGGGNDILRTLSGNDVINSGGGNDTIEAGAGTLTVDGGAGDDSLSADISAYGAVTIDLQTGSPSSGAPEVHISHIESFSGNGLTTGAGNDTIITRVSSTGLDNLFGDRIDTGAGDDTVTVGGGYDIVNMGAGTNDRLIVDYQAAPGNITSNGSSYFYNGTTNVEVDFTGVEHITVSTGGGNDTLRTLSGDDVINAGGGNDTISAGTGTLTVDGGDGDDAMSADISAYGAVTIDLQTGAPSSGAPEVHISHIESFSGEGLTTGAGNDTIVTRVSSTGLDNRFDDRIDTGAGDDTVTVGGGGDLVHMGGGSNDRLIIDYRAAPGNITSNGASYFYNGTSNFSVDFTGVEHITISTGGGTDFLNTLGGDDVVSSGGGTDNINTFGGNDLIDGGAGGDTIDGGANTDTISYASSSAGVTVNLSTNTHSGGDAAGDSLSNIENITGSSQADSLTGTSGANLLTGGGGDDTIDGLGDTDTAVYSGNRVDYVAALGGGGAIILTDTRGPGFDGEDTIRNVEFFQFADGTISVANLFSPVIAGLATSASFNENTVNATPQVIDGTVNVTIYGSLDGGSIVVSGLLPEDAVTILNAETGLGQIGISGNNVSYEGTIIGTATSGAGSRTVTFNADATQDAVNALIEHLVYRNTSDTPTSSRDFTVSITDGSARESSAILTLNVTPQNDAPAATITLANYGPVDEQTGLTLHGTGLSIADPDAANGSLTVTLAVGEGSLNVSAGSTGAGVVGSGGSSVTLTGTITQINNLLAGNGGATVSYIDNTNAPAASTTLTMTVHDNGNSPSGDLSASDTATIAIAAVNDTPVNTVPGAQTVLEDTNLSIIGLSISDPDGASTAVITTLSVAHGTLTILSAGGAAVTDSGTATVTLSGTVSQINTTLAAANNVVYRGSLNFNGADALTVVTNDGGNTGSGGALGDTDPVAITVTAVNDVPTTTGATIGGTEDATYVFTSADFNFSDAADAVPGGSSADAFANVIITSLPASGTLMFDADGAGGAAPVAVVAGQTISQANIALGRLTFVPGADNNGAPYATFQFQVQDSAATSNVSATATATVNVAAVNDAPVVIGGSTATLSAIDEDATNPSGATVASLFGSHFLDATDQVSGGSSANGFAGVAITANAATTQGVWQYSTDGTTFIALSGVSTASAFLLEAGSHLRFVPALNFNGPAPTLTAHLIDNSGGAITSGMSANLSTVGGTTPYSAGTVTLGETITAVNDSVTSSTPPTASLAEDGSVAISGLSISDVDATLAPGGLYQVTLAATNGTVTLGTPTGLTFSGGDGTSDATMTFRGTLANINAALASASYAGAANYNGAAVVTISVTDDTGGPIATGSGSATSDSDIVNVTITAVNDPVTSSAPAMASVAEDASVAISGLLIADVDATLAPGGLYEVTLAATHGTLTLGTPTGLSFSGGDGSADATMTFRGTLADINAALATASYAGAANYNGAAVVTISVTDETGGPIATGSGSATSDSDVVNVTVTAVNDPVTSIAPPTATLAEDASVAISGLSIADVDATLAPGGVYQVTLAATHGTMTLGTLAGLSFTIGDGTADTTMTFRGTLADLNTALATASYAGAANYNGAAVVTISVTDDTGGPIATGSGSATGDSDAVNVTVTAVNDAPVVIGGSTATLTATDEDTTTGDTVASLFISHFLDATDQVSGGSSASGFAGVAIMANAATTQGVWQYSTDGTTWSVNAFSGVSTTSAFVLEAGSYLRFVPAPNFNGPAPALTAHLIDDFGGPITSGTTADLSTVGGTTPYSAGTVTLTETVTAVNDPVTSIAPPTATLAEDASVAISGLSIADVDATLAPGGVYQVTLAATHGTMTLTTLAGLSFTIGDGTADATMTFHGTLADLNTALATASYAGATNYNGAAVVTISVTDDTGGPIATGSGSATSDNDVVNVTITAVNDAPVAQAGTGSGNEDTDITGQLVATDVEGDNRTYALVADAAHGTVVVNTDGTYTYTPDADYNGGDSFTYKTNDGTVDGNVATVGLTVNAVNDAPTASDLTQTLTVAEDAAPANLFTIAPVVGDIDGTNVTATLTLSDPAAGVLVGAGTGVAGVYTITGTLAAVNAALAAVTFDSALNFNGTLDVAVAIRDGITEGPQGSNPSGTVSITVTAVNDAPVNTIAAQTGTEDTDTPIIGLSVSDADIGSGHITVTLTVQHGTIHVADDVLGGLDALDITDNDNSSVTLSCDPALVNATLAALNGVVYRPDAGFNGTDTLMMVSADGANGGTAADGEKTDSDTVNIVVAPVNDAPTASDLTQTLTVAEDAAPANLFTIAPVVDDIDSTNATATLTLSDPAAGVLVGAGTGVAGVYTIIGTLAAVNAALAAVTFDSALNFNGTLDVAVAIRDGGTEGPQGSNPSGTVSITVTAVNDAPALGGDLAITLPEGGSVTVTTADLAATDLDNPNVQLVYTLTAVLHGELLLNGSALSVGQTFTQVDLAANQVSYHHDGSATSTGSFSVALTDGIATSQSVTVNATVTDVNHAPQVNPTAGANVSATAAQALQVSSLFSGIDADGDTLTYFLYDANASANSGHFVVGGNVVPALTIYGVTAAQLAQATFVAGAKGTSDDIYVQAYDGIVYSGWNTSVHVAVPANVAPTISLPSGANVTATGPGQSIAFSSLFAGNDVNGDALTYFLYDGTPAANSGHWSVNGTTVAAGVIYQVSAAQLAQTTFVTGASGVADELYVQDYDGQAYSGWNAHVHVAVPANVAPTVSLPSGANVMATGPGQSIAFSSLFAGNDVNGDALTYFLYDGSPGPNSGHWSVNGTTVAAGVIHKVSAAQLAQTTFVTGASGVADELYVQDYDGQVYSGWNAHVHVAVPNNAPTISLPSGANVTATGPGQSIAFSSLFAGNDVDGDTLSYYLYDGSPAANSGHWSVNGTTVAAGIIYQVSAAQLAQTTFVTGASGIADELYVQDYDGHAYSGWNAHVHVAVSNNAPTISLPAGTAMQATAGQSLAASGLFSGSDVNGDTLSYYIYDSNAAGNSGHFEINGTTVSAETITLVTAAQLAQTTFVAGAAGTTDYLYVEAFDGHAYSPWTEFHVFV